MTPLLGSMAVASVGASAIGLVLSMGTFIESEAISRGMRDCVTRPELRGAPICSTLATAISAQSRAGGVVLAGTAASGCAAFVAFARRRDQG